MCSLKIQTIVATFELEPIILEDDTYGSLKFRIEVLKNSETNVFFPRIYRWEILRVQPTFPQEDGEPINDLADHELLVKDFGINCDEILEKSIEEALEKTINKIKLTFMLD
jgi:hypothetical protein